MSQEEDSTPPVSLEFFKKCIFHEEIVRKILKVKANGNEEKLKQYLESESMKKKALHNYYKAFYLKPEIREKHPIRLKPMPERKRNKLLQLPEGAQIEQPTVNKEAPARSCSMKKVQAGALAKRSLGEEIVIEDDIEPYAECSHSQSHAHQLRRKKSSKRSGDYHSIAAQQVEFHTTEGCQFGNRGTTHMYFAPESNNRSVSQDRNNNSKHFVEDWYIARHQSPNNTGNKSPQVLEKKTIESSPLTTSRHRRPAKRTVQLNAEGEQPPAKCFKCKKQNYTAKDDNEINYNKTRKSGGGRNEVALENHNHFVEAINSSPKEKYRSRSRNSKATSSKATNPSREHGGNEYVKLKEDNFGKLPTATTTSELHASVLKNFAHRCPVTFKDFQKYTNIFELVQRSFDKKNKSSEQNRTDRILYWVFKYYLVFYLYPQFRSTDGIMKYILVQPYCPEHLKDVIFQTAGINNRYEEIDEETNEEQQQHQQLAYESPRKKQIAQCKTLFINKGLRKSLDAESTEVHMAGTNDAAAAIKRNDEDLVSLSAAPPTTSRHQAPMPSNDEEITKSLGEKSKEITKANRKNFVEILENRTLPNVAIELMPLQTPIKDPSCKFCQVSLEDFIENTNVLELVEEGQTITDMYISFMQLDEQVIRSLTVAGGLFLRVFKCSHVCSQCAQNWPSHALSSDVEMDGHGANSNNNNDCERMEVSQAVNVEKDIGKCVASQTSSTNEEQKVDIEKSSQTTEITKPLESSEVVTNSSSESQQVAKDLEQPAPHQVETTSAVTQTDAKVKSSMKQKTNSNTNDAAHSTEILKGIQMNIENSLQMIYSNEEWHSEFQSQLLKKLQEPFDYSQFPVTVQTFKKCSKFIEPLQQIICDFCGPNGDLVSKLLANKEICDNLLLYYYRKYFTNSKIRHKYPLKLRMCPAGLREKMMSFIKLKEGHSSEVTKKDISTSTPNSQLTSDNPVKEPIPTIEQKGSAISQTSTSENLKEKETTQTENWLEKTKKLFNIPRDRTHTLAYVLRTTFGLKQQITNTLSKLLLNEFKRITHIHDGHQSYQNDEFLTHIYEYIGKTSIWPKNVFIKLEDLLLKLIEYELLLDPLIDCADLLLHISPKFLHWSNLMATTNFIKCVQADYLHRNGEPLDQSNKKMLDEACQSYYSHCWNHDHWIGETPKINDDILKYLNRFNKIPVKTTNENEIHVVTALEHVNTPENEKDKNSIGEEGLTSNEGIISTEKALEPTQLQIEEENTCVAKEGLRSDDGVVRPHNVLKPAKLQIEKENTSVAKEGLGITEAIEKSLRSNEGIESIQKTSEPVKLITSVDERIGNAKTITHNRISSNQEKSPPEVLSIPAASRKTLNSSFITVPCNLEDMSLESLHKCVAFTQLHAPFNEHNYFTMPNTQDQIGALPAETQVSDNIDPLENRESTLEENSQTYCEDIIQPMDVVQSEFTNESSVQVIDSDDEEPREAKSLNGEFKNITIKKEPGTAKFLQCLEFAENSDGKIECKAIEQEIITLDCSTTSPLHNESENLPSLQINFEEDEIIAKTSQAERKLSPNLISSGSSGSTFCMAQRIPTYSYYSESQEEEAIARRDSQEEEAIARRDSQEAEAITTIAQFNSNLPDIVLSNSSSSMGGNASQNDSEKSQELAKEKVNEKAIEVNESVAIDVPMPSDDNMAIGDVNVENVNLELSPKIRTVKSTTKATTTTKKKDTAKVKRTTDCVPQLLHTIRPLPLQILGGSSTLASVAKENVTNIPQKKKSQVASVSDKDVIVAQMVFEFPASNSNHETGITLSPRKYKHVTRSQGSSSSNSEFDPAVTSTQTGTVDVAARPVAVAETLRISQELANDCTVFNNTSLLRALDQVSKIITSSGRDKYPDTKTDKKEAFTQPSASVHNDDHPVVQPSPSKIPRRIPKVNKATTPTVAISKYVVPPLKKKLLLYYKLIDLHYFHELKRIHVANYQLTNTNYGSSHIQATILNRDFKTKLTNSGLHALLGFSSKTKADFFNVLKDLGEFHYNVSQHSKIEEECDLRKRVLFWFIHSSLPFSFAQLSYDKSNSEYSDCKAIKHAGMSEIPHRKPYKCLSNAIDPKILENLEKLKKDLKNKN